MWSDSNLLIDGQLVPADGGRTFESINPATESVVDTAPDAAVSDAERAIAAARRAFDETSWSADRALRVRCLRQLVAALRAHVEELRELTVAEVGVPVSLTSGPALEGTFELPEYYADLAESYDGTVELGAGEFHGSLHNRWVEREPFGVVGAISAYNYPHQLNLAKLSPALAAGCTVVLKGAPDTPLVTLALGKLIAEHTDTPAGVVNVLASSEAEVGQAMTTAPDVDMITFTGSTAVGRAVMSAASVSLKKCFLELGGKSAYLVLDEESLPLSAMFCSFAAASHAGQGCAITSRLVVPRSIYDDAIDAVRDTFQGLSVGDPTDPSTYMGPLINARQRQRVQAHVDRARAEAAVVVVGGGPPAGLDRGFFFEPTLIAGADENSAIAQEEIFGPVLVVLPHDGDDDAVRVANNSIYGLSGSVQCADRERAFAVARRIRSGTVSVNGGMWHAPNAPFGGYGQSGIGRENGIAGLEEFLQTKTLAEPLPPQA